jgi:hypothetical protein
MHRSILVSHSESLVADSEYAALVTTVYLLMPLVDSAQDVDSIAHCPLALVYKIPIR